MNEQTKLKQDPDYVIEPYSDIAYVYDYLLRHVDYQGWYDYIKSVMHRFINEPSTIVELGCGTGRFGAKFAHEGYTIFGIDKSMDMLRVAKTRAYGSFRILCADITNFCLAGEADFIFSVHDTMNYQLTDADVRNVIRSAKNVMHDKSIFMFDITTEFNIYENFHRNTSRYTTRGYEVEWRNDYDKKKKLVTSHLKIRKNGRISEENHIQRIYSVDEMKQLINDEGMELLGVYGDHSFNRPGRNNIMINFVTRKK